MMFMHVLVVESLCQAVTGQFAALKFLELGPCGSQWLRLVLSSIKCPHCPMTSALGTHAQDQRFSGMATRGPGCVLSWDTRMS
jgi:hypothetical protein